MGRAESQTPDGAPATGAPLNIPPPAAQPSASSSEHAGLAAAFGASPDTQSSFFGSSPPPEDFIEAEVLQRAFDSNDESVVDSIFGEDLISDKSLDEVILSYLAEDL